MKSPSLSFLVKTPILKKISVESIDFWKRTNQIWVVAHSVIIALLVVSIFPKIANLGTFKDYCPLDKDGFIHCGKTQLINETNSSETFKISTDNAIKSFQKSEYEDAAENFKIAFDDNKSPETLIYFNNALLEMN